MKIYKLIFKLATPIFASALVAACGSISFFPVAPAQKAADKVIEDIWPSSISMAPTVPVVAVGALKEKEPPPGPLISPKLEAK